MNKRAEVERAHLSLDGATRDLWIATRHDVAADAPVRRHDDAAARARRRHRRRAPMMRGVCRGRRARRAVTLPLTVDVAVADDHEVGDGARDVDVAVGRGDRSVDGDAAGDVDVTGDADDAVGVAGRATLPANAGDTVAANASDASASTTTATTWRRMQRAASHVAAVRGNDLGSGGGTRPELDRRGVALARSVDPLDLDLVVRRVLHQRVGQRPGRGDRRRRRCRRWCRPARCRRRRRPSRTARRRRRRRCRLVGMLAAAEVVVAAVRVAVAAVLHADPEHGPVCAPTWMVSVPSPDWICSAMSIASSTGIA